MTAAATPLRGTGSHQTRSGSVARRAWFYLPAVVVFVAVIGGWEAAVVGLGIEGFILPRPSVVVTALVENWNSGRWPLADAARNTLFEAFVGLAIGVGLGVGAAFLTARWASVRDVLLPAAIAANAVPIIAFAPLFNNWFGLTNPLSKAMVAAVLVFFPIMINVTRGLTAVPPASIELMRSYAASEWAILRQVRVPNALPYFFIALKVGATLSLIGAIVSEYFGGSSDVLGRVIVQSASALRFDVTWAAIVLGSATGILLYLAITAVERVVIPWHASQRNTEG